MPSLSLSMPSKFFTYLLHAALVIILTGACVTHFIGEQGQVHLRLCETSVLQTKYAKISIFLWDFHIENDPVTHTPMDFVSELRLIEDGKIRDERGNSLVTEGMIRMNKPLNYHGCRLCQSDYDSDGQGVILSYNYDPWGIGITYTGYGLLLVAMLGFFFQRRTLFQSLLRQSVFGRNSRWLGVGSVVLILLLAGVMTRVVTPKPPLQPVLQTPLLGIHVSVIMLSYTLFAAILINGILALCRNRWREPLYLLSEVLLYPALFCLTAGIFIGAVWANLSWGRYWGWDPKETWALITMIIYALLLHLPFIQRFFKIGKNRFLLLYHLFSIIAFIFVLFTYFGVNHLLGGMHSYA